MDTAEAVARDLYAEFHEQLPTSFQWEDERQRQTELMFCAMNLTLDLGEREVREIVQCLSSLNLLDIELLAKARLVGGADHEADRLVSTIEHLLERCGAKPAAVHRTVVTLCEIARAIATHYNGRLQTFLRHHGEAMAAELVDRTAFTQLDPSQSRRCMVHWLQNALEMPVPMATEYFEQFCKEKNISPEQLIDAFDTRFINLAIIDDLARYKYEPVPKA